jgi:hypothetical protein
MKYAIIIPEDGYVIKVLDEKPEDSSVTYVKITNAKADQIENNNGPSYIIDGIVYDYREKFEKERFESNPDQYKNMLRRKYANQRYIEEISGIDYNGVLIRSDRVTQSILGNARQMAASDSYFEIDWKVNDSTFVHLTSSQIIEIADLMVAHVQTLFTKEKEINEQITNATSFSDIQQIVW